MAHAKTGLFDAQLKELATQFKAMSHPARLRILQFLAETKTCITGDISEELPLGRTTVNQHLKELKEAGLIVGHIEGAKTRYCLIPEKVNALRRMILEFVDSIEIDNYNCG